ncbi:MAG: CPBP family intramembrane glutamic endopeptidase [Egibacteraceae bacterium]
MIVRYALRHNASARPVVPAEDIAVAQPWRGANAGAQANITRAGEGRNRRKLAPQRLAEGWEDWRLTVSDSTPGLFGLASGGALEELSYRGFIAQICLQAPSVLLRAAALVATTAVFALSHVWFGWAHVAGKAALGIIALGLALSFQSVVPAMVAHVIFNTLAWRDLPRQGSGRGLGV